MPPVDFASLVDPTHTAIVTSECQKGVIGDEAVLRQLADSAQLEAVPNILRLLPVARAAGVAVVHCLAVRRPDDRGSNTNARLFTATRKLGIKIFPGSTAAEVLDGMGPEPDDLVLTRYHGLNPMGNTDLDSVLRNLGVTTLVATGVSVNMAILNMCMDAVNANFQVVLPRDAVAGVPKEYADSVIDNTLRLITTVTTTDDLIAAWT
jgi:nicotinamidase-related amidase